MTTAQELLDAGVDPKNIPTLTAELNKPEFGGLADTEFMVEAGRFGNTDANLQLGLNWWWDTQGKHTQIFDTGQSIDPHWMTQGRAISTGRLPEGVKNTGDLWARSAGYANGKDWFDSMKKAGKLRPEVVEKGFDEWEKEMLEVGKDPTLFMYIQSKRPLEPETWTHEFSHIGQYLIRKAGITAGIDPEEWKASGVIESDDEEKQRVRDIMMSSPGDLAYEDAHEWLQYNRKDDQGNPIPYTSREIRKIAEHVLLEDEYANQVLESQGGLAKPSGDISQYETQHMPGFWDSMMKKLGLKD